MDDDVAITFRLEEMIRDKILPLARKKCIYLDLPYHANIGDILIWEGTRRFLARSGQHCLYSSSSWWYHFPALDADTVVYLHGGGNFGDVWYWHQKFRLEAIKHYSDNRIVILPQTVHYANADIASKDAEAMSTHPDLWFCARDERSYTFLKKNFSNNVLLVPDMAFAIKPATLKRNLPTNPAGDVFVKRTDHELVDGDRYERYFTALDVEPETRDWPTLEKRYWSHKWLERHLRKKKYPEWLVNLFAATLFRREMIRAGVDFLGSYRTIYTTRLHAAILGVLLGRPVRMFDNNYGKNSTFYATWLANMSGVEMILEAPAREFVTE